MRSVFLLALFIALSNSAFALDHPNHIVVADEDQVRDCRQLDTIEAREGYRMMGTPEAANGFKDEVLKKAQKMGATHVTWTYVDSQLRRTIYGRIYKCGSTSAMAKK